MSDREIPGVRHPLTYPRIAPEDRPAPELLAEQRLAADPRRAERRPAPPQEETK